MAWDGYALYAGNEIFNVARTTAYARAADAYWFRGCIDADAEIAYMLGELAYQSPLQDDAPWTDPDFPDSYDFYGFYPLEINGIEDSTRSSQVVESTIDGGIPGRIRHGTKQVVFSGALLGSSEAAVEYGMRWLKRVLLAGPCGASGLAQCLGDDFCYLSSRPCLPEPCPGDEDYELVKCLDPYWRTLKKFAVINGPTVTSKRVMSDGCAAMWTVTFTGVAGNPFEYGKEVPIVQGFMDPAISNPYVSEVQGYTDLNGYIYDDTACAIPTWAPLQDPLCPTLIAPPSPPDIPLGCYTAPTNWKRRSMTIPDAYVPGWDSVVPLINIHAVHGAMRNLRIRFYADPFESASAAIDDGCAFCGDFVVSFLPQGYTLTLDGPNERVFATEPGGDQMRADSLVFASDGTPMIWPELSCGFGYVVTFDMEQSATPPTIDLSLIPRTA